MIRKIALPLILCALLVPDARAFEYPLSPEQVREGYFLGRNPEKRQIFFSKYIHILTTPRGGPDVHLIEFRTPYEQVALRSQEHWANYTSLDAEKDYADQPDQVVVRVYICATQTFSFEQPPPNDAHGRATPWRDEDYLQGFEFRVSQALPIKPKNLIVRRALMGCPGFEPWDFAAMEAFLQFDADQFASSPVKIQVIAPGGQVFATTFDPDQLQ
jgi:hypothetical protein